MRTHPIALIVAALAGASAAATFTVSKDGRGDYPTIQAAVDKAGPRDIVEILDTATYNEQVTLRSPLHHLTLRSSHPSWPRKPVIRWSDNLNVGPKTCQEALDTSKITFDRNGALRLIGVRDVRIEGIAIDGANQVPFAYPSVWGNGTDCNGALFPNFHGNTGLLVYRSSQVVISECEIANAYFGAYIKDNDPRGPFAARGASSTAPPFARMASGNHFFAGNSIHHNAWGVFMESAWGLGSTFRDNLLYENHHATPEAEAAVKAMSSEGANQPGGAFYFKDAQHSSMAIQNNTFWHNFLELAGGFRAGAQHLLVNNIFAAPNIAWSKDPYFGNPFVALDPYFPKRMKCNAYAGKTETPTLETRIARASETDTTTGDVFNAEKQLTCSPLPVRIMNNMPALVPDTGSTFLSLQLPAGVKTVRVPLAAGVYPGAPLQGGVAPGNFSASDRNRWVETKFRSLQPSDTGFLAPTEEFQEFLGSAGSPLRYPEGNVSNLGALPRSARPLALLRLVPLAPVLVEKGQMVLRFSVQALDGGSSSGAAPVIAYLRLERNLPSNPSSFGGSANLQLPEAEAIPLTAQPIRYGYNEVTLPQSGLSADSNALGFIEMAVQGMGTLSNVAQFPILPLASLFTVEALDETQDAPATDFAPGKTFRLRIAHAKSAATSYSIRFSLASGATLKFIDPANADSAGVINAMLPYTAKVQFTEAPDDGIELIWVSAYRDAAQTVTGFGQSPALAFEAATSISAHGKKRPSLKAADVLRRRNLMGRKLGASK